MTAADFVRCKIVCHDTGRVLGRVSLPPALARDYDSAGIFGRPCAAGLLLEEFIRREHQIEPTHVVRLVREEPDDAGPCCSAAVECIRAELHRIDDDDFAGWSETVTEQPLPAHIAEARKRWAS